MDSKFTPFFGNLYTCLFPLLCNIVVHLYRCDCYCIHIKTYTLYRLCESDSFVLVTWRNPVLHLKPHLSVWVPCLRSPRIFLWEPGPGVFKSFFLYIAQSERTLCKPPRRPPLHSTLWKKSEQCILKPCFWT